MQYFCYDTNTIFQCLKKEEIIIFDTLRMVLKYIFYDIPIFLKISQYHKLSIMKPSLKISNNVILSYHINKIIWYFGMVS